MEPLSQKDNRDLLVIFGKAGAYAFTQPSRLFPSTEVTIEDEAVPNVFFGAPGPLPLIHDGAFCVFRAKMVQHSGGDESSYPPIHVALKWVAGKESVASLRREAEIYEQAPELVAVRRSVVRQYYGFFTATIDNMEVACMILEWHCGRLVHDLYELDGQ